MKQPIKDGGCWLRNLNFWLPLLVALWLRLKSLNNSVLKVKATKQPKNSINSKNVNK